MKEESDSLLDHDKNFTKDESFCKEYNNILESFTLNKEEENQQIILVRPINDPLHNTGLFGTEIAFFKTYIGIKHYNPDIVISMGYAGEVGVNTDNTDNNEDIPSKLKIGSVVIAKDKTIYHRRNMIIDFFENTSKGHYPVNSCSKLVESLGYNSCSVGTANSFLKHDDIAASKGIEVVEMELCSVARACCYFNVQCIGIKIISDGPDQKKLEDEVRMKQFLESLPMLKRKFYDTYLEVNKFLIGKNVSDI